MEMQGNPLLPIAYSGLHFLKRKGNPVSPFSCVKQRHPELQEHFLISRDLGKQEPSWSKEVQFKAASP